MSQRGPHLRVPVPLQPFYRAVPPSPRYPVSGPFLSKTPIRSFMLPKLCILKSIMNKKEPNRTAVNIIKLSMFIFGATETVRDLIFISMFAATSPQACSYPKRPYLFGRRLRTNQDAVIVGRIVLLRREWKFL